MRVRFFAVVVSTTYLAFLGWPATSLAQVSDTERAAARQLFKEGDELQRAGRMSEALDKFQRAERVYSAPTNVLRIAECQAALGKLVESSESYRSALRMPLPAGSPQAFQAAMDQAKGELAQIEPRVPKLVVQVAPATAAGAQLQVDGQSMSAALIGEAIPLDPGTHRVRVLARGFETNEQDALLKERETTTVMATLKPTAGPATPLPAAAPRPSSPAATAAPASPNQAAAPPPSAPPAYAVPPPPPAITDRELSRERGPSNAGLLVGAHLGLELGGGRLPLTASASVDTNLVAGAGVAYGLDGGLRFFRHWYLGVVLERADMQHGDLSQLPGVTDSSTSTTLFAGYIGFVSNPDRTSFYGEVGAGTRSLTLTETIQGQQTTTSYSSAEFALGGGVWVPIGRAVRVVPKLTIGFGSFDPPGASTGSQAHSFVMLGVSGFYNLDF